LCRAAGGATKQRRNASAGHQSAVRPHYRAPARAGPHGASGVSGDTPFAPLESGAFPWIGGRAKH
jgi:hypothetical protein